jgi:hypothetical protein
MSPLLALSGHSVSIRQRPLSGAKADIAMVMSAFDPKQTLAALQTTGDIVSPN